MNPVAENTRSGADDVAEVACVITEAGLVEGFGHVSTRCEGGFLITPTLPMDSLSPDDVLELDAEGRFSSSIDPVGNVPLEAAMHAAIYASREDINAICRTHSPAVVLAGARGEVPPLVHGLGGLAGEITYCDRLDLVTEEQAGAEVAAALGTSDGILLRGNGSLSVGKDAGEAAVRAYYLEERCLFGSQTDSDRAFNEEQLAARSKWFAAESMRAWVWLRWRYAGKK